MSALISASAFRRLQLLLPGGVGSERDARPRLALRVDLEQVFGHVLHDLPCAAARARPVAAAEAVQRGLLLAAQVLLYAIQVLDRHEQAVGFGVLELEVLAVRAVGVDQPHAAEARDAVVDVNDQLARGELQRELPRQLFGAGAGRGSPSRRGPAHPAEELCVGEQVEPDPGLRAPGRQVLLRQVQARVQLDVDVEVGLPQCRPHGVGLE